VSPKSASNSWIPVRSETSQPRSHNKGTKGLSRMKVSSSLLVTIHLYILIPYESLLPLFLFPIFCKASEVKREKARQVGKNLIQSLVSVSSVHGVDLCTRRTLGAGRVCSQTIERPPAPYLRPRHWLAVAELDAVLPGAPQRPPCCKIEIGFPGCLFLASQGCRGALHSRYALLAADLMAMSSRAVFIIPVTDLPGLLSLVSQDYSRD
jgi:hypothetical protein